MTITHLKIKIKIALFLLKKGHLVHLYFYYLKNEKVISPSFTDRSFSFRLIFHFFLFYEASKI